MNRLSFSRSAQRLLAASLCVLATGAPVQSADNKVAPGPEKIRSIEGVTEYRLRNGLQILLLPDESSSTVTVNMTYKVGSRNESYGETGMAHLLEHMSFKGTPSHTKIYNELTSHGAEANASTSDDRTNYFETLLATDQNLEWALGMEADRMTHSFIAKKDLDSEMTVVRNEFESGENNPAQILSERVLESAYLWHNYRHPTIGARADIENVPITRLKAFYHTYYQPDNATLIITGKFDERKTLDYIQRVYSAIPKPTRVLPNLYTEEPTQDGEREVTLRRTGGQKVLIESYHIPADAQADTAALGLLAAMLDDRPSGRLYEKLIETKLATQASATPTSAHDPGYLMFTVVMPKDGDLPAARKALTEVMEGLRTDPFSAADLDRVRTQQLNEYERLMSSSAEMAANLSENVAAGDWRLFFWDRDNMKKVTLADVQRVASTYLISSNLTAGTFIPEDHPTRTIVPPTPELNAMLRGYSGQAGVEAGEHFDPTPANVEARIRRGAAGFLQTAFLEKKSRGVRVSAVLSLHFGRVQSLKHLGEEGRFTAALLMRGTQEHTRQQLQDELTRLKATMNVQGTANGVTVTLETIRDNLPQVLRLASEVLQHPIFPADQLDEIKRERLARIDNARTDPEALAAQTVQRYLSPYPAEDFRYVATFDEQSKLIGKLTVADLQRFHKEFYGASNGEAALVGSFDSTSVSKLLTELFGTWKSASPYERAPSLYKDVPSKSEKLLTPDKANAIFTSAENLKLRDDDADYPALYVGNAILGGGFLNSRLTTRVRQHDGLSYTVGSDVKVDSLDPVGSFYIYAICAPQNIGKVENDVHEEIARALTTGFTTAEIEAAKSGILQSRIVARSNDNELASQLASHLYLGRDFSWDARYEHAIDAVSSDAIQKAMHRHIKMDAMITLKVGDFALRVPK